MRLLQFNSLRLAAGLAAFAVLVSGCFQTVGAALEGTPTPLGGAVIVTVTAPVTLVPTTEVPPPTAISPSPSPSLIVPSLQFGTPIALVQSPTITEVATQDLGNVNPTAQPIPPTYTPQPTYTPPPTYTPLSTYTVFPTYTPQFTFTPQPTYTPSLTPSNTVTLYPSTTPTEPIIITPTRLAAAPTKPLAPTAIALAPTARPVFDSVGATQTQQALNVQATGILQTVTMAAAQQQTLIATSLGTGVPGSGAAPTDVSSGAATLAPSVAPTVAPVSISGTPQGTPGAPGSGAAGPITGDCQYTVVDGDRLFRIALRFNLTAYQLAYANRLINPDLIVPGEVLRVPNCNGTPAPSGNAGSGTGGTPAAGGSTTAAATGGSYMVIDGDTLYGIATRYHVRVMSLAQANNISNISLIYIGQMLTIPGQ